MAAVQVGQKLNKSLDNALVEFLWQEKARQIYA